VSKLEAVVLASDFHPRFLNFYPVAKYFWEKHFGVSPRLAIVYHKHQFDLVRRFRKKNSLASDVVWLEGHPEATLGNQAKLARWFLASRVDSNWTTIDDLDTIHLRADYLSHKFNEAPRGKMLAIGREVYFGQRFEGAFPMGNFSGHKEDFQSLFELESDSTSFINFVERFRLRTNYRTNPFSKVRDFSDEELLRDIRYEKSFDDRIHFAERGLDITSEWLDRSWWPKMEEIKGNINNYESVNFFRPYYFHRRRINLALKALDSNWSSAKVLLPISDTVWNFENQIARILWRA
jgi:hypothetical protein